MLYADLYNIWCTALTGRLLDDLSLVQHLSGCVDLAHLTADYRCRHQ